MLFSIDEKYMYCFLNDFRQNINLISISVVQLPKSFVFFITKKSKRRKL